MKLLPLHGLQGRHPKLLWVRVVHNPNSVDDDKVSTPARLSSKNGYIRD